jgi:hypothetical protein
MARAVEPLGLQIRVGMHTCEVEVIDDNVRGVAVHAAARVLGDIRSRASGERQLYRLAG